jgi:hypothetical protein
MTKKEIVYAAERARGFGQVFLPSIRGGDWSFYGPQEDGECVGAQLRSVWI